MKRALVAAALVALALAAPAAALLPAVKGSSVGDSRPLKAYASVSPVISLFGDDVTARIAVIADTKWIDPARLRVTAKFNPYKPVSRDILRTGTGRFLQLTWTWTLRCETTACVPKDGVRGFTFAAARIDYLGTNGKPRYGIDAHFPRIQAFSQITPGAYTFMNRRKALPWVYSITPIASPSYRIAPSTLYWLALVLAGVLGAAALAISGRAAWRLIPRHVRTRGAGTALDRALELFFWAREQGDETLQRKALERVADELGTSPDLSEVARALAWSPETPEDEEVRAISDQVRSTPPAGDAA